MTSFLQSILLAVIILLQTNASACIEYNRLLQQQDKWLINFTNLMQKENNIVIQSGRYYQMYFSLVNNDSKSLPHAKTEISLKHEIIQTSLEKYYIHTIENNAMFYIGTKCDTPNNSYTVQFNIKNTQNFRVSELSVVVQTNPSLPVPIEVSQPMKEVPIGSYAIVNLVLTQMNVDPLNIKWLPQDEWTNDVSATVEEVTVPKYTDARTDTFRLKISINNFEEGMELQKFKPISPNQCFVINQNIEFIATKKTLPDLINANKSIVNSLILEKPELSNGMKLSFTFDQVPAMLNCVLQCRSSTFISEEEIRNPTQKEEMGLKYFSQFLSTSGLQSINFKEIARGGSYKLKCILESTHIEENKRTSSIFTMGYFSDSLNKVKLDNTNLPTPTYCMNWEFRTNVDTVQVENALVSYCERYFFKDDSPSRKKNGCLTCATRYEDIFNNCHNRPKKITWISPNPRKVGVCVYSYPTCSSNYQGLGAKLSIIKEDFGIFAAGLEKEEDFKTKINLTGSFPIISTYIESDEEAPELSIITTPPRIREDRVEWYSIKKGINEIECNVKITKDKPESVSIEDFDNGVAIINNEKPRKYFYYRFNNSMPDNEIYRIIYGCYNIPRINTHYRVGKLFSAVEFNRTLEIPKLPKANCTELPNDPECKVKKKHLLPSLNKNPEVNIDEKINEFKKLDNLKKKLRLFDEKDKLFDLTKQRDVFNQVILLTQLVSNVNCTSFDNYHDCRDAKKDTQYGILIHLQEGLLNPDTFKDIIKSQIDGNTPEDTIKLALISLFYLADNADAFDKDSGNQIFEIVKFFVKETSNFMTILDDTLKENSTHSKKDVMKLLFGILSNLIDVTAYDEIDKILDNAAINPISQIIQHQKAIDLKKAIDYLIIHLLKNGDNQITDNLIFYNDKMANESHTRILNEYKYQYDNITLTNPNTTVNVIIPTDYLNKISNKTISNAGIVLYSKYPLLSVENKNFSDNVIGIRMYDLNGKEIQVSNITIPFEITYPKPNPSFRFCYFFNEDKKDWDSTGVFSEDLGNYTKCLAAHLSDFTIGNVNYGQDEIEKYTRNWLLVFFIIGGAMLVGIVIIMLIFLFKKRPQSSDILIDEQQPKGEIQMKKI